MSRFYVGQRVKLVRSYSGRYGLTGKILRFHLPEPSSTPGMWANVSVHWNDGHISGPPSEDYQTCTHTDQLEPITDTYEKASWNECVWKPEHLRTEA